MHKILLVDDAPERAPALKKAIAAVEGATLACVVAPSELAERVAEHRPDIVVVVTTPEAVLARFGLEQRLRAELEQMKTRLAERKTIERAKGILMTQRGLGEDDAFKALRSLAMQRGIRLGAAAQQVIDVAALLG